MAEIVWLEPASNDLEEIAEYIALFNPEAADRFVLRVLKHVSQLANHPRCGSIVPELFDPRYRQLVEPPVRIFYRLDGEAVYILHILRFEKLLRLSHLKDDE